MVRKNKSKNKVSLYHNYNDIMHLIDQLNPTKPKVWQYCCNGFTVQKLIDTCPVHIKDMYGSFLVVIAALYQSKEMLASLNLNMNTCNAIVAGSNPLTCCIFNNSCQALQFLLNNGVDVNAADSAGNRALHLAVYLSRKEIVDLLLRAGANPNLTALFRHGMDLNKIDEANAYTPIQLVMNNIKNALKDPFDQQQELENSYVILDLLLQYGADPYTKHDTTGELYCLEIADFLEKNSLIADEIMKSIKDQPVMEVDEKEFFVIQTIIAFGKIDQIFSRYAVKV